MLDEAQKQSIKIVGGGPKKVLYTLKTIQRIGLANSAKALKSRNACKACGLGMGGQHGGMTNEADEFPSVCNKSIQAQSTDIQPPIPVELFDHDLNDFKDLSAYELERLGRLNNPIFKPKGQDKYQVLSWSDALDIAVDRFGAAPPERSFFYSSGRSSNEAGFVLQLLARLYGTNNVNNCSYYCHQATGVGLGNSIGTGTATVALDDLQYADLIFVIGANPASNHPRFIHQLKKCRDRGGKVIVINPAKEPGLVRFAVPKSPRSMVSGGTWIASTFVQPNIGSDLALLNGIAKALLEQGRQDHTFIAEYTRDFDGYAEQIAALEWDAIIAQCGVEKTDIESIALQLADANNAIFSWGMGITHHLNGVENVEAIANLALLSGMLGKPGAGLLPLRGHSNVQGIGSIGVKPVLAEDVLAALEDKFAVTLPTERGMDTLACLNTALEGKMDAALIMGGNLYSATPNSDFARKALDAVGFKLFLTTTLNEGHVNGVESGDVMVLPVAARDEEPQSTTQESMFNYVRLSDGGIKRLDNVRSEVEILADLGSRLLEQAPFDFALFKEHRHVREAIASCIPGMEALADIDESKQEFSVGGRIKHEPIFDIGRARFLFSQKDEKQQLEYPFTLASIRSEGQFNSIIYEQSDSYRGAQSRWTVLLSHHDCQKLGLEGGDRVTVKSQQGEMVGLEVVPFDLPSGNVLAYYPEANVLIDTEHDPRSKTPAFKSVPVKLEIATS
ncbi:FdhF/YdeP family oxidoreductase [Gilvimarinus agarilyticus]|uniref:FdhF/YdeP family oxidoreductase n=1 Tax=unclassified Gilvimarinus TaxID=2642066 RepID=UPI001C0864EA|nr:MULTISPECIES: FdhF/YdeP family oxidoreductase [unclassified Gilvimarinus]MBU2887842.1 FdhF/YdeP family oxidoreductase [Gilvimarinus agarilyticus]MDO6572480.1 FdhF/YdeP family oxidoreductase [Gilvimarinus sp. 2_MG-2023]MDO6746620.1 FdhF/YdeP family oxidoreductase [Gilvimarinus sp. 1_MG-2023]